MHARTFALTHDVGDSDRVSGSGLRERKKRATREALGAAALRLALEKGPENVRVDDIAEAAGVSPRTYHNYFTSREQAIIAAVTAERETRIAAAVLGRTAGVGLGDAVIDAVVKQYENLGENARDVLQMITSSPALRAGYADTVFAVLQPLADALVDRAGGMNQLTAEVLAASVAAAARIALKRWLQATDPACSTGGRLGVASVTPSTFIRDALTPLLPALDAAAPATGAPNTTGPERNRGEARSRATPAVPMLER